jgi:hypothetical protein
MISEHARPAVTNADHQWSRSSAAPFRRSREQRTDRSPESQSNAGDEDIGAVANRPRRMEEHVADLTPVTPPKPRGKNAQDQTVHAM